MQTQVNHQEIAAHEKEQQARLQEKLAEVRAMPVVFDVSEGTSDLFPLMEILPKVAERLESGLFVDGVGTVNEGLVRIEQGRRVVIFEYKNGEWREVVSVPNEAPTWSASKGWND